MLILSRYMRWINVIFYQKQYCNFVESLPYTIQYTLFIVCDADYLNCGWFRISFLWHKIYFSSYVICNVQHFFTYFNRFTYLYANCVWNCVMWHNRNVNFFERNSTINMWAATIGKPCYVQVGWLVVDNSENV